jgi:hypothetical protein
MYRTKKKHTLTIVFVLVLCAGGVFGFILANRGDIVSQEIQELDSISIEKGSANGYGAPVLLEREDAEELFNELSSTSAKKAERRQNDTMEFDPPYIITMTYKNGQSDQIHMTERGKWFRWYDIDKYVITNNNDTIIKLIEEYLG